MKRFLLTAVWSAWVILTTSPGFAVAADSATTPTATAHQQSLCWTQDQCKERIEMEEGKVFSEDLFVLNPESCATGNLGYCYPPEISYPLIIDFGAVSEVQGLAGYVKAVFSLAIVLGTIGVVLTVMIAGLKWMTARGNPKPVSDARDMIEKAITSLVILLLVVTAARLVDPKLATLPRLRTPLVKQVNYIPYGSSCDTLHDVYGFSIDGVGVGQSLAKRCGDLNGKVTSLPQDKVKGGAEVIGVAIGDECFYTTCNDQSKSCILTQGSDKPSCRSCADFVAETGIIASASTCGQFARSRSIPEGSKYYCAYFPPESTLRTLLEGVGVKNSGYCTEPYTAGSSSLALECPRIQNQGCDKYNEVQMSVSQAWLSTGNWATTLPEAANTTQAGFSLMQSLCGGDVCQAGGATGCKVVNDRHYVDDPNDYMCVSKSDLDPVPPTQLRPEIGPKL